MNGLPDAFLLPAQRIPLSCVYRAVQGVAAVAAVATFRAIILSIFHLVQALSALPFVPVIKRLQHQLKNRFEYSCAGTR